MEPNESPQVEHAKEALAAGYVDAGEVERRIVSHAVSEPEASLAL